MKNMTLERITEVCGGVYYGSEADKKKEIAGAVIDSRIRDFQYKYNPNNELKAEQKSTNKLTPQR